MMKKKCLDINFAKYLSEFRKVHYFNDISGNTGCSRQHIKLMLTFLGILYLSLGSRRSRDCKGIREAGYVSLLQVHVQANKRKYICTRVRA